MGRDGRTSEIATLYIYVVNPRTFGAWVNVQNSEALAGCSAKDCLCVCVCALVSVGSCTYPRACAMDYRCVAPGLELARGEKRLNRVKRQIAQALVPLSVSLSSSISSIQLLAAICCCLLRSRRLARASKSP